MRAKINITQYGEKFYYIFQKFFFITEKLWDGLPFSGSNGNMTGRCIWNDL